MIIKIVYNTLFYITMAYTTYFTIMTIIGLFKKRRKIINENTINHSFAILIPARNEEKVINNILDSLNNLNYPKNKYTIYVIPNNCTDNTKIIAKEHDVKILDCSINPKTKADVLRFAFNKLKNNQKIDAYIIFDADNVVHPDFLINMNNCLNSGYNVAQGYRNAKNPSDSKISGSYTLFYLLQNTFFNYSRFNLNLSPSINGTGFMIKKTFIEKFGFDTKSLTEDVEFTGLCTLSNEKIAYVENAITYDEYPNKFIPSWHQRKRWSSGMLTCTKLYTSKLLKNFVKTGNISSLDIWLMFISPIIQVLSFINFLIIIIVEMTNKSILNSNFIISSAITIIISYIIIIISELFVIYLKKERPAKMISGILFFPIFLISWIPINIACLIKRETEWKIIHHNRNIKINDILK